jgi:type 1 fimbria pilin
MKKMITLVTIAILAMLMVGVSYSMWSKTLYINGIASTGILCARFVPPVTSLDTGNDWTCDPGFGDVRQLGKDVGNTSARIVPPDNTTIEVTLNNTYPSYYDHIDFWMYNCGTMAWILQNVTFNPGAVTITSAGYLALNLSGGISPDVEIYWGDDFGTQVPPKGMIDISFAIHVLQAAPQNQTLTFTVSIVVVNWDEYVP